MISKVFEFMEQYRMIEENDMVAIGVSSGADSLCLLYLLLEYQKKVNFFPVVVHINHGLRDRAIEEARYVEKLCEYHHLPFYLKKAKVKEIAAQRKISTEEAGRQLRYEAFEEALKIHKKEEAAGEKIAVAHHGEDQAETLLFHLFRGTGIYGMAGIMPVRGKIIRPLLLLQKEEIYTYLREKNISWYEDESNYQEIYTRNKIRNKILPYAKEEINSQAVSHLSRAAMQMVGLREYLEEEVRKAEEACCKKEKDKVIITIVSFLSYPKLIRSQLLLALLSYLTPGRKDITSLHIEEIERLIKKEGNKQLDLPMGIQARKQYDILVLEKRKEISYPSFVIEELKEGIYSLEDEQILEINIIKREESFLVEENQYTKYLDYDKISNCLSLRTRQRGDYLTINEKGQRKSVKEYMIEEKIPRELRSTIPLVAEGSHILWIIGYRISAYYKVTEKTKTIVQMKMKRRQ